MQPSWFIDILRELFFVFDKIVYNLIDLIYQLFMMIAETGIFRSADIRVFAERIYFFLGLIMVFKVSISIIQFIANPDSAKDNKIGAPKLLKNLVIILLGIILIPYVFEAAYSLQRLVLRDNVIGNLILGMNYTDSKAGEDEDMIKTAGKRMAFTTFTAFFHLDTDITDSSGEKVFDNACATNPFTDSEGKFIDIDGQYNPACKEEAIKILNEFIGNKSKNENFKIAYKTNNFNYLKRMQISYEVEDPNEGNQYLFDYSILISTAAGAFVIWILLGFCVDIAVRNVKLGFLQLIAPIPLIAKIDPQKGDETFNKWVKECTSTYLSLFGRLVAIYFAIFLLSLITGGFVNVVDGNDNANPNIFVKVFFIFGILTFAKDLPNVLKKLFPGLELDGKGLGLKNKLNQTPIVGAAANKALGLAGRTGLNLAKGIGKGAGKGLLAGGKKLGGFVGGKARKAYNDSAMGQRHAQRVLDGVDIGTKMRTLGQRVSNRATKIGQGASAIGNRINDFTGGAFSTAGKEFGAAFNDIGIDAKGTFSGMGASIEDSIGILENQKNLILNRQSSYKLEMEKNKNMVAADDSVRERAIKKVKESAIYAEKEQHIETLKQQAKLLVEQGASQDVIQAKEAEIGVATSDFGKWANKTAVYEYIDKTGDFAGRDDADIDSRIKKRDDTAIALGYESEYVNRSAKQADDVSGQIKSKNTEIEGTLAEGNNKISKIDEKIRSAKEFSSKK